MQNIVSTSIKREPTCYFFPICAEVSRKAFLDQIGKIFLTSASGNKYIFAIYNFNSNYIMAVSILSQTKHQLKMAYKKYIKSLHAQGLSPKFQRLDNKTLKLMK